MVMYNHQNYRRRTTIAVNPCNYLMADNFATVVGGRGQVSEGLTSLRVYDYYQTVYDLQQQTINVFGLDSTWAHSPKVSTLWPWIYFTLLGND